MLRPPETMDPVRYRILGTTQALRADGTPVPVGGARLRALLTALALRPGRAVPAAVLVDEVWDGDPPADAAGALQALVGRLRRALGADAVASADGGYRLCAAADDIDLHRFERLAGGGRPRARRRRPRQGGRRSSTTPSRSGAAPPSPTSRTAPPRPPAGRPAAWTPAAPASPPPSPSAGPSSPCPTSPPCATDHPLDEPLQALRLRALRDAGRTAEALAAYEDVRTAPRRPPRRRPGPRTAGAARGVAAAGRRATNGHRPTSYEHPPGPDRRARHPRPRARPPSATSAPGSPPSSAGTPT